MKVLTGIDLPLRMSCGSMVLAADIYGRAGLPFDANFLCLDPMQEQPVPPNWTCLPLDKSLCLRNAEAYHGRLRALVEFEAARYRPDILHCQHLGYGMSKALVGCTGVPKIGLCHGTDVIEAMNSEAGRRDLQFLVDRMDRIVFPSRGILNDARRIASIAETRVSIIPWGIPDSYLLSKGRRPAYTASPFRVLYAGRLDPSKGIPTLLQAIAALPDSVHLTILGEGPDEPAVRDMIAALAIDHRTELQRWRTRSGLQQTFLDFQLLVLPSLQIEAFGLVSVEAQAAGLPVLVANVSGLPETLPSQAQELAFEAGNAMVLTEKITGIAGNERIWRHYSELCLSNAGRFVISNCVRRLDDLSRKVLDEFAATKAA
jgi:glycosyltransferase involved in cell wall biosynthesis